MIYILSTVYSPYLINVPSIRFEVLCPIQTHLKLLLAHHLECFKRLVMTPYKWHHYAMLHHSNLTLLSGIWLMADACCVKWQVAIKGCVVKQMSYSIKL